MKYFSSKACSIYGDTFHISSSHTHTLNQWCLGQYMFMNSSYKHTQGFTLTVSRGFSKVTTQHFHRPQLCLYVELNEQSFRVT